jgi:hypothetical protein
MNTTNAVVLTGLVVVAGRWANDKPLDIKLAVGTAGLAIFLSVLNSSNPELAGKFTALILLAAVFLYGPGIAEKTGLVNTPHRRKSAR